MTPEHPDKITRPTPTTEEVQAQLREQSFQYVDIGKLLVEHPDEQEKAA